MIWDKECLFHTRLLCQLLSFILPHFVEKWRKFSEERMREPSGSLILSYSTVSSTVSTAVSTTTSVVSSFPSSSTGGLRYSSSLTACGSRLR